MAEWQTRRIQNPLSARTCRFEPDLGYQVQQHALDRVAVVVNGNARRVTDDLVQVLNQIVQSGDLYVSRDLDEAERIARTIVERNYPTVLTGGGDGTFVQMVTLIERFSSQAEQPLPRFGLLKLGTGNALAWVLGNESPRGKDAVADLSRLRTEGGSRELRLLNVEGTLTPFAGLGVDAICLDHYNSTKQALSRTALTRPLSSGAPAYAISIVGRSLPEFLFRGHPRVRIVNEGAPAQRIGQDDRPEAQDIPEGGLLYEGPSRLVAMSTIPYWGLGARIFPFAEERDDRFQLRVGDIHSLQVAGNIRSIWRGTYRAENLHDFLVERIAIHFEDEMPLQIGGDAAGRHRTVRAKLAETPIRVVDYYAPPDLAGH